MKSIRLSVIAGIICCLSDQYSFAQTANPGFRVEAVGSQYIPLTVNKMTNILFPTAIRPGIKVSRDILAQRPAGSGNVLVLKAARRGFAPTNLSVYGADGRLYSFELRYDENPPVLNFLIVGDGVAEKTPLEQDAETIARQKKFMHHARRAEKMQLILKGIYIQNRVMWFSLVLRNHSGIEYAPENIRWVVRDERRVRRTAVQEIVLGPEYTSPLSVVPGDSTQAIVAGFRPFTLPKDKVLVIQVEEKDGRSLSLTLKRGDLLKTKTISHAKE